MMKKPKLILDVGTDSESCTFGCEHAVSVEVIMLRGLDTEARIEYKLSSLKNKIIIYDT